VEQKWLEEGESIKL